MEEACGSGGPGRASPLGAAMSSLVEAVAGTIAGHHGSMKSGGNGGGKRDGGQWLDIAPEAAVPMPAAQSPRRIAYVDGGNATLLGSPGWSVGFNRVAYALCRGEKVLRPSHAQRVDFMSLLAAEPEDGGRGDSGDKDAQQSRRYVLRAFPVRGTDGGANGGPLPPRLDDACVPTDADLGGAGGADEEAEAGGEDGAGASAAEASSRSATDHNRSRMMSVPRAFAEWKMAAAVVERELEKGDVLVMDGTLQTGYGGEARLADTLYDIARSRGVVVCALAKTTTLMAAGGVPVLYAAQEAARMAGHHTWYMPLARRVSGDGSGFVLAARLHRHSRFTYRLEVLRDQYDAMDAAEIGDVIGSIAANSGDPSFPGYPYGLISADRNAKVRGAEAAVHRRMLLGEMRRHDLGRTMVDHSLLLSAHKTLNRAVGGS